MKGYRLNPDAEHVAKICAALAQKSGHCPCRIQQDDTTLCPCDELVSDGSCRCNLFIKTPMDGEHP